MMHRGAQRGQVGGGGLESPLDSPGHPCALIATAGPTMASTVTIEAHRRRFNVKASPMMPLSALVADVLGQLKLTDVQPASCQLLLKGKPLDLSTPVRFANVGREKLELKTGHEPVLGVQHAAPAAAATPPAATPVAPAPALAAPQPASAPSAHAPPAPAAAAPLAPQAAPPSQQQQQQQQAPTASAAAGPSQPSAPAAPPADASHPSVALFGCRVWVFTRQAEQQAEGGAAVEDVDDSFYDFTETDLRRAMASQSAARAKQEGGHLMTAAMREKEERRRAQSYGDVPIRLYLPDGQHCLQTLLPATSPLSAVLELARTALVPGAASGAYLFTTPPRQVLKDLSLSLYSAKLVPAAKVHVGLDAAKVQAQQGEQAQQLLRPEVLALAEAPPQRAAIMHTRPAAQAQAATEAGGSGGAGGSGAGRAEGGAGAGQQGKPVPKWLKLGGK